MGGTVGGLASMQSDRAVTSRICAGSVRRFGDARLRFVGVKR